MNSPVNDQPPMIWLSQRGALAANFLPLPIGKSYSKLVSRTCVLLKSDSDRSRRKLWMSVGVRLKLVLLSPPLVLAPVGSTDMSSMDLLKVYEKLKSSPCSKRRRADTNKPW